MSCSPPSFFFFFFNDTATTEIYPLSLHDALPICIGSVVAAGMVGPDRRATAISMMFAGLTVANVVGVPADTLLSQYVDRKSTRLNSSHVRISYAVFCLKKKKILHPPPPFTTVSEE